MPELHWKGKKAVLNHHLEVPYKKQKLVDQSGDIH